ncbi:Tm-1-like ATP-binding domain-containing protein [Maritalea mediterranea]|uniref:Tm-1-like ATP-binding domain-containing protein n=1 Tax=Maritalea mediterranea TaxID=2909667 RepID=A0ABS9E8X8_9HYPH|nr:Tm-1-like ATP-binding domain-containing protein [Maritalea mediterranea]MCF4099306.1 Tm-1-like ATP-binding domain-containing protein [Maritalea mediterranea]
MGQKKTILVIGTYDTKSDELDYLTNVIKGQGGNVRTMDVSVLGDPPTPTDISKHQVAEAADATIQEAIGSGDENVAMQIMARGAAALCRTLQAAGRIDGMIAMGGSMGTDLALDCARALPLGVPKYIISTIAFSPLIPADRLATDIQMILWAGGLYGLNAVCRASLSQAAGAVLGAAQAVQLSAEERPMIGMTSLGSSCLRYMKILKPALEERGFEVAIFHATGMGGMAFENLARAGKFACVMDFAPQEMGNELMGSVVNSGPDRLRAAAVSGTPAMIAPGCVDLVDFPGWQPFPEQFNDRSFHAHNRLLSSATLNADERRQVARELANRAAENKAPTHIISPIQGIEEWDKPGEPAHEPDNHAAFVAELAQSVKAPVGFTELDCHINDQAFNDFVLELFDQWLADGIVKNPKG